MRLGEVTHGSLWLLPLLGVALGSYTHDSNSHHHKHRSKPQSLAISPAPDVTSHRLIGRADDYTCNPDRECKNKACCGSNNVCGYGELYCGKGCQSNCDAKAECGRDAAEPGQVCPLNICCSEFGFCGTTADFCTGGCQSNCNDPDRPSPGQSGDVRNKVIGYYESWRAEGTTCGLMRPEGIPVEYLTQVNLAFVYIDPVHLTITDMDEPLTKDIYARVADVKSRNPAVKVWLSVGGWTFNDPGAFQSVFTILAANPSQVEYFAVSLMGFMDRFGFDGVDLDWEYPGADDRGGRPEDVENFPRMLRILKKHLQEKNRYSKKFGLSITLPTSYWYLRWFDVKALEPVVDEFNIMAYDLHGTWDKLNPIGPYVLAHTNLTEIEMALDLFWRNNISPSRIILGLAFYGRTYELQTPLCASPGCEWKNPGPKGKCTATAGILSYREIQELIAENNLDPDYDEDAGVYYVQYGEGGANWVSFDDDISFKAKTDLANQYGLGGLLIWAVDQDNDHFSALQGVLGKSIAPVTEATDGFGAFSLDECYITDCEGTCKDGDIMMTKVSGDESGRTCVKARQEFPSRRSFCCPAMNAPDGSTCEWRGSASCRGKCLPGEVTMLLDDKTGECNGNGAGAWCCPATNGQETIAECQLHAPGLACPPSRPQELTSVLVMDSPTGDGHEPYVRRYCCPRDPEFKNCGWHGEGLQCEDSRCPAGQVAMFEYAGPHASSDRIDGCTGSGRKGAFCCDPPLSGGSPFLPVPLENLFPDGDSFPTDYSPTFAIAYDSHKDHLVKDVPGQQPNKEPFAWIVMVGEDEDLQSFDKRDGSDLELFDCPSPDAEDYSTQTVRAVCLRDDIDSSNCLDIKKGGVEGTIVRLPSECGPDRYVRAVKFEESMNSSLPHVLRKRYPAATATYDFHYDYNFRNLRRDGGEIYFRADLSTHPGYWENIVAAPVKRSASTWREHDRRWLSEVNPSAWLDHFKKVFGESPDEAEAEKKGLKKHYEFRRCLVEGSAICGGNPSTTVGAEATMYGELNTTMDMGMTLIGTLRRFDFSEAFATFAQHDLSVRVGAALRAQAMLHFDTDWHPLGTFDVFGMNMNLKGIFTINPYFALDARLEAEAYVSAQATVEMTLHHEGFRYYLPRSIEGVEGLGDYTLQGQPGPVNGIGDIEARVGGGLLFHFRPTIGVNLKLHFADTDYVDTSIKLASDAQIRFDLGSSTKCTDGLQVDVAGGMDLDLDINGALPGWKDGSTNLLSFKPRQLLSECIPFAQFITRDLHDRASLPPIPDATTSTCATSVSGIYCSDPNGNDDPDPNCDLRSDSSPSAVTARDLGTSYDFGRDASNDTGLTPLFNVFEKRDRKNLYYCDGKGEAVNVQGSNGGSSGWLRFPTHPPGSQLAIDNPNVPTFDAEDFLDCTNFNLAQIPAPKFPTQASQNRGRTYQTEHLLEGQTIQRFFNSLAVRWSNTKSTPQNRNPEPNPNAVHFKNPAMGKDNDLTWCEYMKAWWATGTARINGNFAVAEELPSKTKYTSEWVLLETTLNGQVKQNWFKAIATYHAGTIETDIDARDWSRVAKTIKLVILGWKYYSDYPENRNILVQQARRVEARIEELEGVGHGSLRSIVKQNTRVNYDKGYNDQLLSVYWRTWVRAEHARVQQEARDWLKKWVKKAYDRNRPPPGGGVNLPAGEAIQLNRNIREIFERAWDEVQNLKDWDIDWDGNQMDTD